jgi:hypothetical protein
VKILLKEPVNGIDIAALDSELQATATAEPAPAPAATAASPAPAPADPAPSTTAAAPIIDPFASGSASQNATITPSAPAQQLVRLPIGTEQTEETLALDGQAVRDIQARLLVLGHDPNGIDGKIGKGTRSAVRAWQNTVDVSPTGFLNGEQLSALKAGSEPQLAHWLKEPKNAKLYEPPPPIALTPSRVSGRWNYTTNCGPRSKVGRAKIRGVLSVRHAGGNRYVGNLANSQGLRARFDGRLNGRTVSSTANFGFLFGKVRLRARVDDHQLVMRGRDSNGCSFYAAK